MRILLLALLVGCSSPEHPAAEPAEAQAPEPRSQPAGSLDEVGEGAVDMPFGQSLPRLTTAQAQAVFPLLLASAAPAEQLTGALPDRIGDWHRGQITAGIQEDEFAPWTGAYATYTQGEHSAVLLIQDTGWQPTALNRFLRAWTEPDLRLTDGRPVANLPDAEHGGTALHAPADPARPRILIKAWSDTGGADQLSALLSELPTETLLPLLDRNAQGEFDRSPLFPPPEQLTALTPAQKLLDALPASHLPLLGEGQGLRRERMRILVTSASRLLKAEHGVIELRLTDLGPAGQPVELLATAEESSADRLREDGAEAKLKCKESLGLCKRMALYDDRFVLIAVGPPEASAEIERLVASFDPATLR